MSKAMHFFSLLFGFIVDVLLLATLFFSLPPQLTRAEGSCELYTHGGNRCKRT